MPLSNVDPYTMHQIQMKILLKNLTIFSFNRRVSSEDGREFLDMKYGNLMVQVVPLNLFLRPSLCPSIPHLVRPSFTLSDHPSLCPSLSHSFLPSFTLPVHPSLGPPIPHSVRPSVTSYVRPLLCPSILHSSRPSFTLSVHSPFTSFILLVCPMSTFCLVPSLCPTSTLCRK